MKVKRQPNVSALLSVLLFLALMLGHPAQLLAQSTTDPDLPNTLFLPLIAGSGEAATMLDADVIPGQYVVVFQDELVTAAGIDAIAATLATTVGGELLYTYNAALNGFALKVPLDRVADALTTLQNDANVSYVEPDRMIYLDPLEVPTLVTETVDLAPNAALDELEPNEEWVTAAAVDAFDAVQNNPVWGLDRIDQRNLPLDRSFQYDYTGAGVRVYIIDSGIRTSHSEFQGRASHGIDLVDNQLPADDCNGHGTHVAGTVGGRTYGVAKQAQLISVRVFGCSGGSPYSTIIAAVNWVTGQKQANRAIPMVANMSLGGGAYTPMDTAVRNSIAAGVTYVIAGMNENDAACNYSPARTAEALTVGATASDDWRAGFSNYGSCLDLFAPGVGVRSAWYRNNSDTATISGTSMATPHVAGAAAQYLQKTPAATPAQVATALLNVATVNVVSDPRPGSPNRLLYSRFGAEPPTRACFPEYPNLPVVLGTDGNDPALNGSNNADRICGFAGDDVLRGVGGNDFMAGNEGNDMLYGEAGNDAIGGGKENDFIDGGEGNDTLTGGIDDDEVYGGMGVDVIFGNDGNDTVGGGKDRDTVYGDEGNDQVYGGADNDNLWGGSGNDTFHYSQGQGNDVIHDFEWSKDRLALYSVTITKYTKKGTTCQLTLSTKAVLRLLKAGACQNPTVAAGIAVPTPTLTATLDAANQVLLVQGQGFGAQELVPLTLNGIARGAVQADSAGHLTTTIVLDASTGGALGEYVVNAPSYQYVDETNSIEFNPVAAVVAE